MKMSPYRVQTYNNLPTRDCVSVIDAVPFNSLYQPTLKFNSVYHRHTDIHNSGIIYKT